MKSKPEKNGRPNNVPKDANQQSQATLESYCDIKNRAPTVIKTWQELMEGEREEDDSDGKKAD